MAYGIILSVAAFLFALIIALLIILWAVPVTVTGRGELCRDTPTLIFAFCIQWGFVSLQSRIPDEDYINIILFGRTVHRIPLETESHEKETEPVKKTEETKPSPDIMGIADAVVSHVGAILHQISIDHLRASVRFGLGDAALTGELFGLLMTIRGMLMATGGKISLAADAEFNEQIVEGDAEGAIRIAHPLSLVPPIIRIIHHPAVWKMVRNR